MDNGQSLTEGPVIVQYLADQKPASGLIPPPGTVDRYRVQEWLNYTTSEIHKTFAPLFRPTTPEEFKTISREFLGQRFDWIDKQLAGKQYLMGDKFTVADAYLFTVRALVAARRHRSRQMAQHHRLSGSRRRPPEGAGSDEGGRVVAVTADRVMPSSHCQTWMPGLEAGHDDRPSADRDRFQLRVLLLKLQAIERRVAAALAQQLVVAAGLDDQAASTTRMRSAWMMVESRWAMTSVVRPLRRFRERFLHVALGFRIERGGRFVEQDDRRVLDQRARDGDALALAAGQLHAVLADRRVVAARESS